MVGKSTVPVGTAVRCRTGSRALAPAGDAVEVAWNPEFLREGFAVEDTLRPDRLVFGTQSAGALEVLERAVRDPADRATPVVRCDLATAELIKAAANAFLATKISFINSMAQMCQAAGGDVGLLADALGYDPRIGREFLNAGLGSAAAACPRTSAPWPSGPTSSEVGVLADLIEAVEAINAGQRAELAELAIDQAGGDVDRQADRRAGRGVQTRHRRHPELPRPDRCRPAARAGRGRLHLRPAGPAAHRGTTSPRSASVDEAVAGAEIVLHLTEWPEFRYLDPKRSASLAKTKIIIDGRLEAARADLARRRLEARPDRPRLLPADLQRHPPIVRTEWCCARLGHARSRTNTRSWTDYVSWFDAELDRRRAHRGRRRTTCPRAIWACQTDDAEMAPVHFRSAPTPSGTFRPTARGLRLADVDPAPGGNVGAVSSSLNASEPPRVDHLSEECLWNPAS